MLLQIAEYKVSLLTGCRCLAGVPPYIQLLHRRRTM